MMNFVVDNDDPILSLGLLLHEIVERITAVQLYTYEIDILEENHIKANKLIFIHLNLNFDIDKYTTILPYLPF